MASSDLVVKLLVGLGHVLEQLARGEGDAVVLFEASHVVHKFASAHGVSVPAEY